MKRINLRIFRYKSIYISLLFLTAISLTINSYGSASSLLQEDPHKYFYISPEGNDKNSGTREYPLKSFEAARLIVRSYKTDHPDIPITVFFRTGKYYLNQTVLFTAADSGTKTGPVKYAAFPGEKPVLLGGKRLNLNWKTYKNGILKAEVPEGIEFESLYIDNVQQILARYPNYDPDIRIFNGTASDCISKEKVKQWADPEGGYFHVIHKALWGGFHFRITGKDKNGELQMEGGWQNNRPENGLHPDLRFVENIFEELDSEKEWYLDKKNNVLYLKPAPGVNPDKAIIEVAYLETFIKITGSESEPVRHLSFDGLTFNRSIRTFMKTKDRLLRSDWAIYRGGSVFIEGAENCSIENCEFAQIGSNAIFVNNYNRNVDIAGCHIHDIGASAICFVGDTLAVRNPKYIPYGPPVSDEELDMTPGPKTNNYPALCMADNNLIHSIGKVEKQVTGVQISMAMNITVSHNSIYDCPRSGINIGEGAWGGHIIEFNDVFRTVLETSDHGSFNSWGRDRFWMVNNESTEARVRKFPESVLLDAVNTTIIRNNRMKCDHGWDIDLDDGSSNYHLCNNLCLTNGIKLREGYYRTVENNICINNAMHPHVWLQNSGDIIRGNIFGSKYYPIRVNYWGTEIDFNWFTSEEDLIETQKNGIEANSLAGNPLFSNPESGDFSLDGKSPLFRLGFKNFPMDNFGVQIENLKKIAETPKIPEIINIIKTNLSIYEFMGGKIKNIETEGELSASGMHEKKGVLVVLPPTNGIFKRINLKAGDVILKVDGKPSESADYFIKSIDLFKEDGDINSLSVWRNQINIILTKTK